MKKRRDKNTYEETKEETHVSLQNPCKTELHARDHLITDRNIDIFQSLLDKLRGASLEFSRTAIHHAKVREQYLNGIAKMSEKILKEVNARNITVQEGATLAQELRNVILEESRAVTTNADRTIAKALKKRRVIFNSYAINIQKDILKKITQLT